MSFVNRRNIYLDDETDKTIDRLAEYANLKSRSNVIATAVSFYDDYLNNKEAGSYLCEEVQSIIKSNLNLTETRLGNRLAKLLSEMIIQTGITQKILTESLDISEEDVSRYRLEVLEEVKKNPTVLRYEKLKADERKCQD